MLVVDLQGNTALYLAAKLGHIDLTIHLIHCGGDVDFQASDGCTPLHGNSFTFQFSFLSAAAQSGNAETVAALLLSGADPLMLNASEQTAIQEVSADIKSNLMSRSDLS